MEKEKAIEQTDKKPKLTKDGLKKAMSLFSYVLPYKWAFIAGMVLLSTGSLIFLAIMKIPGEILNIISGESNFGLTLGKLFGLLIIMLIIQSTFSFLRVNLFAIVSEKSVANLRRDLYKKLISLEIPFFEERRVGELTSRISNDVTQVQGVMSLTLAEFVRQVITLLGGVAIIIFTMPSLALTMLLTFPLVVVAAMFMGRFIRKLMKERQDKIAKTNVVVEETMQSVQTVKAFTNEWFEVNRYMKQLKDAVDISLRAARFRGAFASFVILVMFGALFFIMYKAALLVQAGEMKENGLIDFVIYTGVIGGAIVSLGNFYTTIVSAVGAAERILDILDEKSEIELKELKPLNPEERFSGSINLKEISFHYPTRPDIQVLKNINMDIRPGERVALVGASGAGKSTIIQLLLQFYKHQTGTIEVDGKEIKDYHLSKYRQNFAVVPQEVMLFGGTIMENILYGKPNATEEEIIEASKKAHAWEFIENFPERLETIVGERGVKLSGGQRQRIAIARAILKDPAVLLLDEATSALDAESEKVVQEALEGLMENRTSIIIAHRLATIKDVDRIYVLEHGRIVEQGTHLELSAKEGGAYNNLAKLQFDMAL
jgi:ABC-type multidrug transport system fused ATPase/permease subunit